MRSGYERHERVAVPAFVDKIRRGEIPARNPRDVGDDGETASGIASPRV